MRVPCKLRLSLRMRIQCTPGYPTGQVGDRFYRFSSRTADPCPPPAQPPWFNGSIPRSERKEVPAVDAARTNPFPLGAGRDTWGLGFQLAARPTSPDGRTAGSFSWAGVDNTFFWVDPRRQIVVLGDSTTGQLPIAVS